MVGCRRSLSLMTLLVFFLLFVFLIRASDARKARVLEPLPTSTSDLQDNSGRNATQIERRTLKGGGSGGGGGGGRGGGASGGRGGSPNGATRGRIIPIVNGGGSHDHKHNAAARTSGDPLIITLSSIIFGIAIAACI